MKYEIVLKGGSIMHILYSLTLFIFTHYLARAGDLVDSAGKFSLSYLH